MRSAAESLVIMVKPLQSHMLEAAAAGRHNCGYGWISNDVFIALVLGFDSTVCLTASLEQGLQHGSCFAFSVHVQ